MSLFTLAQEDPSSFWGLISLSVMFVAGLLVVFYTFRKSNRAMFERALHLPLEDDPSSTRGDASEGAAGSTSRNKKSSETAGGETHRLAALEVTP